MVNKKATDKAGKSYWDECWEEKALPKTLDPNLPGLKNLHNRRVHNLFTEIFSKTDTNNKELLEIGCGMSIFLSYFAKEFNFKVTGLDYSEIGCEQERKILKQSGVKGKVVCADFFKPPSEMKETFDFVFSFGVAEHFIPTESCLTAFADFLKPGGKIITVIPNMNGWIGLLTKIVNRPVYDIHVVLDKEALKKAHKKAGMKVETYDYFLSSGLGMANTSGLDENVISTRMKDSIIKNFGRISVISWKLEDTLFKLPNTKTFSPYVFCVAEKN